MGTRKYPTTLYGWDKFSLNIKGLREKRTTLPVKGSGSEVFEQAIKSGAIPVKNVDEKQVKLSRRSTPDKSTFPCGGTTFRSYLKLKE